MMTIPVYIALKEEHLTYALVDSMSDTSFISTKLFNKLNIPKSATTPRKYTLNTVNSSANVAALDVKGLKLRGYGQDIKVKLPTMRTTDQSISINKKHIPSPEAAKRWTHLQLVVSKILSVMNLDVDILLGANCNGTDTPLEIVSGLPDEPHARQTVHGWTMMGLRNR